ncbi:MAG: type II toxin-antitoxin system VapC family toxin [Chloroflexota bacterium]
MTRLSYVDASAIVKLVVLEEGSDAMLRWYVESDRIATSRIGIIETTRAVRRRAHDPGRLRRVLGSIEVIECDAIVGDRAGGLEPATVRTLDAIHVASALALGAELDAFVTYDERLADAARAAGLPAVAPAF